MKTFHYLALAMIILFSACKKEEEEQKKSTTEYSSLKLNPEIDTIYLNSNAESRQFLLVGSVVNTSDVTISNSGIITDASFTVQRIDTVLSAVPPENATWNSTNSAIATVNNGLIVAHSAGYTSIFAQIGKAISPSVVVNVRAVDTAPGLSLDPPEYVFTMEDHISISGSVQSAAKLLITESRSGFSDSNIVVSNNAFSSTVTGLQQGLSTVVVRATHPTNALLFTERSKIVTYYVFGSLGADSLVGNWMGNTLGKDFPFAIQKSILFTRYDITGKLDIQFQGVGLVKDIDLIGVLNNNGTITATLKKEYNGFTISGHFTGKFETTGKGNGAYDARAAKPGWPTISFNDYWTAVKLP